MNNPKLALFLIGIGAFIILISGIPKEYSFQALGDTLTGIIFIIIGAVSYSKNKNVPDK